VDVADAYEWDPAEVVAGVSGDDVAGVEAVLWSETVETMPDVEFLTFPRLPAVAEVAWSPPGRSWPDFRARLAEQTALLERLSVPFYRSPSGRVGWRSPAGTQSPGPTMSSSNSLTARWSWRSLSQRRHPGALQPTCSVAVE
jgi:hexosaminidase